MPPIRLRKLRWSRRRPRRPAHRRRRERAAEPDGGLARRDMNESSRHLPNPAPIDAYGNGGFRFAGMSHRGSLLCLPSGIYAWDVKAADDVTAESCAAFLREV